MQWYDWNILDKKVKYVTQRDERLDEIFDHMRSHNMGSREAHAYFGGLDCKFLEELLGPFDDKIFKVLDGFEDGLSVEQVSMYAYRQYSLDQMEFMRQAFKAGIPVHAMEVFLQTSPTGHALFHRVMEYENNPDSLEVFEAQLEEKRSGEKFSMSDQIRSASDRKNGEISIDEAELSSISNKAQARLKDMAREDMRALDSQISFAASRLTGRQSGIITKTKGSDLEH